jgi:5-methylcytosine-specific restriction endonuclease McrA
MPEHQPTHIALFGGVALIKGHCQKCLRSSIVSDGKFACCGRAVKGVPDQIKRESVSEGRRRPLPLKARAAQLQLQNYRCFYCDLSFGSIVFRKGRAITLRTEWDHSIPFAYSQDNRPSNFVAACQVCNALKHSFVFQTEEEAKVYVKLERERKGYSDRNSDLPALPKGVQPQTQVGEVLLGGVPDEPLPSANKSPRQRPIDRRRSGVASQCQQSDDQKTDSARGDSSAAIVRAASDTQTPNAITPLRLFCMRHNLSTRKLSVLCGGTSGISKSSAARLIQGTVNSRYVEEIKPILLASLRKFLVDRGLHSSAVETELESLFISSPLKPDTEQIITVPSDSFIRYIFKDESGRILHISEVKG